jgi:hypothetical protein
VVGALVLGPIATAVRPIEGLVEVGWFDSENIPHVMALALGGAVPPGGEEPAAPALALRLEAPRESRHGESVTVRVELVNRDPDRVIFILNSVISPAFDLRATRAGTYIWPFQVLSFEVRSRDEELVPYRGGVPLELTPPTDCELAALGPGESHGWSIRLDQWYDLSVPGKYSIAAVLTAQTKDWFLTKREKVVACRTPGDFSRVIEGTFRSNVFQLEVK